MTCRIEADFPPNSDWLPAKAFKQHYDNESPAVAAAIEGVEGVGSGRARGARHVRGNRRRDRALD